MSKKATYRKEISVYLTKTGYIEEHLQLHNKSQSNKTRVKDLNRYFPKYHM